MLFNYDLFEIVAVAFVVSGLLTFSIYKSSPINNESLVNTNLNSELSTNLVDVAVQTEVDISIDAATTYVNTGMQTSARMWLESLRNWINEILGSPSNPSVVEGYVDVGVQTNGTSTWQTVKQWCFDQYSMRSSELSSIGHNKVAKWRNKLDSTQSVDLHDSDSPLTTIRFETESELQQLVDPNDSSSQRSEVIHEVVSNPVEASNVNSLFRIYDMSNRQDVLDLMNDPTVLFGINGAYDPADDLITFITPDASYEILRSTLDTLLNSVN